MSEQGTVTKIDGADVTVRIDMEAGCAGCMNHEACGVTEGVLSALDPDGIVGAIGDRVEIATSRRAQAAGVFWFLGLPLVLFAAGYAAGSRFFATSEEGPAALLGIGGFVLGLVIAWLSMRGKRASSLPRVVRMLAEKDEEGNALADAPSECPACERKPSDPS